MSDSGSGGAARLAAGSRVAGYRLERQIGRGPIGVVLQAVDEQRGLIVALKIIGPPLAADQGFASRLLQQAQAAAALGEPHILPVFQAGQADGVLFVAMPSLDGADARSLVRREGALPSRRTIAIVSQVASALDAAHAAGLVHGDVKPPNILVQVPPGQAELVYLSDFGQGRTPPPVPVLAGTQQASEALDCIAPEQLEGRQAEGPADQYALACVAYELLTGAAPFRHDELDAPPPGGSQPPTATSVHPGLPPAVDGVLGKALAPVPAHRYASCSEFADALSGAFLPQASQVTQAARMAAAPASAGAGPVGADPSGRASPSRGRAPWGRRSKTRTPKAHAPRASAPKGGPPKTGPPKAGPSQAGPPKAGPSRARPPQARSPGPPEPLESEPLESGPLESGPPQAGPPKDRLSRHHPPVPGGPVPGGPVPGGPVPGGPVPGGPVPGGPVAGGPVAGGEPWLVPPRRRRRIRPAAFAGLAVAIVAVLVIGLIVSLRGHRGGGLEKPTAFRIAAQSATTPEHGHVWTVYQDAKRSTARVYGSLRGVSRGETARLYAQPFPFRSAPSAVGPAVALHPAGQAKTASYSFQVAPAQATRYHVEVFPARSASSPLARSAVTTIYVTGGWAGLQNGTPCRRPVCHETVSGEVLLPPAAVSTEMAKPPRPYFGLRLAKSGNAPAPSTLQLGGGDAHVTTKPLSAGAYEVILTFTFSVGKAGNYNWFWTVCVPDTVGADGIGLPGHPRCGNQTIPARENYLGIA